MGTLGKRRTRKKSHCCVLSIAINVKGFASFSNGGLSELIRVARYRPTLTCSGEGLSYCSSMATETESRCTVGRTFILKSFTACRVTRGARFDGRGQLSINNSMRARGRQTDLIPQPDAPHGWRAGEIIVDKLQARVARGTLCGHKSSGSN